MMVRVVGTNKMKNRDSISKKLVEVLLLRVDEDKYSEFEDTTGPITYTFLDMKNTLDQ